MNNNYPAWYQLGKIVKVVSNSNGHKFPKNTLVRLLDWNNQQYFPTSCYAESVIDTSIAWSVRLKDCVSFLGNELSLEAQVKDLLGWHMKLKLD